MSLRAWILVSIGWLALVPVILASPLTRADEAVKDGSGRVIQYVGDDGTTVDLIYEGERLVRAEYSDGKVVIFVYDAEGKATGSYETHE